MSKHTEGPWKFDPIWALVNGPKGEEVAAIHAAQDGTRRVHPQTAHANAHLIAAAPELLEACKRIANEMQAASSSGTLVGSGWLDRRILILREAIAKAEGGV